MKKILVVVLATIIVGAVFAQDQTIKLPAPEIKGGLSIMETLKNRKSIREYSSKKISQKDLSKLLWAAIGINRPDESKLTAPTAMDKQEVTLYYIDHKGAYLYNAKAHTLDLINKGDFFPLIATTQDFVKDAPAVLVIVSNTAVFGENDSYAYTDAGMVSQNISLFCAGNKMATVPRGMMDKDGLSRALRLRSGEVPVLNHPVGYLK
ncbi:MAG: SagB/ThcOx family dehydrogenase [Bacteroidales bacterium]|jgi:nitroreductase|nr:SagB/ThcOx family dehydrogenase [Bacteroidales bacterium]